MKLHRIIFILALIISLNVHSEPSPQVKWLMNEPASMFDLGMLRIQKELDWIDTAYFPLHELNFLVVYVRRTNKIRINFNVEYKDGPLRGAPTIKAAKQWCGQVFKYVRDRLDVWVDRGHDKVTLMSDLFTHQGYVAANETKVLGMHIAAITDLSGSVWVNHKPPVFCKGDLGGDTVNFGQSTEP